MRGITATTTTTAIIGVTAAATFADATSWSSAITIGPTIVRCARPYHRYYRGGYLPTGWRTRVVPVPVYYEPQFVPVPHGYHRGFIDGHVVVHNSRGFILDIAAVF